MGLKLILAAVVLFTFTTGVILFGDSPSLRGSFISKIRHSIVKNSLEIYTSYERLDSRWNGRVSKAFAWIVPVFYFALISVCLHFFFTQTFPLLPESISNSAVHNSAILLCIVTLYSSFLLVTFSDPGYLVLEKQVENARAISFSNDIIFFGNVSCYTCHRLKPARLKHCLTCGHCVAVYDHHCVWVNNCIGYYNYRWFILYLMANIIFLVYGDFLCYKALQYQSNYGSWWHRIAYSTESNKTTGIFLILCSIFVPVITIFTVFQFRYIYLGVTTNECEKWSEIEYLVNNGSLYKVLDSLVTSEKFLEKALVKNNNQFTNVFISLKDEKTVTTSDIGLQQVQSTEKEIDNDYDLGFWENFRMRVWNIKRM